MNTRYTENGDFIKKNSRETIEKIFELKSSTQVWRRFDWLCSALGISNQFLHWGRLDTIQYEQSYVQYVSMTAEYDNKIVGTQFIRLRLLIHTTNPNRIMRYYCKTKRLVQFRKFSKFQETNGIVR